MKHFSKLTCIALLGMVSQGAGAYNYISASCGNVNFNSGHMTFNYGNNLTIAEKNDISIAFARLTAFSDSSITTIDNGDSSYSTGNGQNEIYYNSSVGTANCWYSWNTSTCNVNEADIQFGNEPWVTGSSSQHWPYNSGRSIRGTAVHEGGHCIGMAHENSLYNMMGDDWSHVTRQGVGTYYGPGEDLSDGLIDLHGKRSGSDTYRDVGATVFRYDGADGAYSEHEFGVLRDASTGITLPVVGSFEGQDTFEVVEGDTVEMELTFENNGEKNSESPNIGFYLSTNSIISTSDTLLRTDNGYSLGRGTPYEVTENVTIPAGTAPGNYFLGALIDHDNLINETTNANNVAYYPISVLPKPSDLTVPFAGVDDINVAPNETIKSVAIVRNDGDGPADATTLRYYRSTNSIISSSDTLIALDTIPALDPGEISSQNADTNAPGSEGTWYYGACVDSVPREISTSNNCSSGTQVTVAWPAPDATTNPATNVDTTSADLNALFNPFGAPHTVYFDWGETTTYGNTVEYTGPIFAGTISVPLSGLVCNTEYHYRVRVVSDGGTTTGGDQQFTTLTCPGCG